MIIPKLRHVVSIFAPLRFIETVKAGAKCREDAAVVDKPHVNVMTWSYYPLARCEIF